MLPQGTKVRLLPELLFKSGVTGRAEQQNKFRKNNNLVDTKKYIKSNKIFSDYRPVEWLCECSLKRGGYSYFL